jgi:hypothetical protein
MKAKEGRKAKQGQDRRVHRQALWARDQILVRKTHSTAHALLVKELILCPGGDNTHRRLCNFVLVAKCHAASARRSARTEISA